MRVTGGVAQLGRFMTIDGRPVGRVCSSGYSPYQGCGVCIVRLDDPAQGPGTQAERLARALSTRFEAGERVVVWTPNIPEWIFTEYACDLAGLALVRANPSFQASELRYVLEQSGAVGLFMVDGFRGNPQQTLD